VTAQLENEMKSRAKFVAVLFGPGRRTGDLVAPGDADCRWRAAATLERAAAVNDEAVLPADADVRADRLDEGR
jgi:hypothetical protein